MTSLFLFMHFNRIYNKEGCSISRQDLNEWIESLHLAPSLFYLLPGFYLKIGFLIPYPFYLYIITLRIRK